MNKEITGETPVRKFKPGQLYYNTCWFTGGTSEMRVDRIEDGRIFFAIERMELDGFHTAEEDYPISVDRNGNESVLLYSYKGEENRIYADEVPAEEVAS